MRSTMVFLYLYVVRLGALDGRAGLVFCRLRASYETMIDAKWAELRGRDSREDG